MFSQNNEDKVVAVGLTAKELVDLLNTNQAKDARRALNFLDGLQEQEMIEVLNDPNFGRYDWKSKGLKPRFRNITKMIVEKSGMLFKDTLPVLEIFDLLQNEDNEAATQLLAEKLSEIEFAEFMTNFDLVLRLLKTAMIMVQWNAEDENWMLDILHRGNAEVIIDPGTRKPMCLVYRSHENCYWVWTNEAVTELRVEGEGAQKKIIAGPSAVNSYGVIPMAVFYDTNTPRTGFWVEQDKSLVNLNEMLNLHILDSEFSILWSKMSTAVTNMRPAAGSTSIETVEYEAGPGDVLPRRQVSKDQMLGGPNEVVVLDSMGVDSPFYEFKSPQIDLKPLNEVMENWIKGYAADWCVSVRAQGEGRAESGFQLIVEEMSNLDLRKQRQRMFESGFKRLYRALRSVYNTASGSAAFPVDSNLFAEFNDPVLPVDIAIEETVWSQRIKEGRATDIDYFMHVWGMNKEEAELKYQEIQEWKAKNKPAVETDTTAETPEPVVPAVNSQMGNQR